MIKLNLISGLNACSSIAVDRSDRGDGGWVFADEGYFARAIDSSQPSQGDDFSAWQKTTRCTSVDINSFLMISQLFPLSASKPIVFERYTGPPVVPTTRPTSKVMLQFPIFG